MIRLDLHEFSSVVNLKERVYFMPDLSDPDNLPDPATEWFGTEILEDDFDFALESIGPISEKMREVITEMYMYYTANDSATFVVFEYDFIEEEVLGFQVLPIEIFHKLWEFTNFEFETWNEVRRRPMKLEEVTDGRTGGSESS